MYKINNKILHNIHIIYIFVLHNIHTIFIFYIIICICIYAYIGTYIINMLCVNITLYVYMYVYNKCAYFHLTQLLTDSRRTDAIHSCLQLVDSHILQVQKMLESANFSLQNLRNNVGLACYWNWYVVMVC